VKLEGKTAVVTGASSGIGTTGIEQQDFTEITSGVKEGQRIITTGAAALRQGDRIVLAGGDSRGGGGGRGRRGGGAAPVVNANQSQQQPAGR
jgi:hypothetical protein